MHCSMASKESVDIGILEKSESWKLQSCFFPSKIGGKPAWLDLKDIPDVKDLTCDSCSVPMAFLSQVYAPIDNKPSAFHRTLFIFICKNNTCCKPNDNSNIKVLRCQIERDNPFYPYDPPAEEKIEFDAQKWHPLCRVCGVKAPSHCAKCKMVKYCHRTHQVHDWKNGHKEECEKLSSVDTNSKIGIKNSMLYPEWELIMADDPEDEPKPVSPEDELKKLEKLIDEKQAGTFHNIPDSEIEPYAGTDKDKIFSKFNKAVSECPDQVLRYCKGGRPLWITGTPDPPTPFVPDCEHCGAKRQYEFQIMPQLLNFLELKALNSIDWGVIIVYTCSNSCNGVPTYKTEFIYKQDII